MILAFLILLWVGLVVYVFVRFASQRALLVLSLLAFVGCGHALADKAVSYANTQKVVVDEIAQRTMHYLVSKHRDCKAAPTRETYDRCMGPIASRPDQLDLLFERVRAAQLALYVALAVGDPDKVADALADLKTLMVEVATLGEQIK